MAFVAGQQLQFAERTLNFRPFRELRRLIHDGASIVTLRNAGREILGIRV